MSRSLKKKLYVDEKLLLKIRKASEEKKTSGSFKTWKRASVVSPEMIGWVILIHNGKKFNSRLITPEMVGFKLGEFSQTRQKGASGKAGKR